MRENGTRSTIKLPHAAAETRNVQRCVRERTVIDRLPSRTVLVGRKRHRLPIGGDLPLLRELPVHPTVFALAPCLHLPILDVRVLTGFEFHEDIISIDQRRLIVDEQVAGRIWPLLLF